MASTYSTMAAAAGSAQPSACKPSRWNAMAAFISASTSATVSPVATQPGRSGAYAEKLFPARSITMAYFKATSLFPAGLLGDAVQRTRRNVVAGFPCDRYTPRNLRVFELAVAAPLGDQDPTVGGKMSQDFTDFHGRSLHPRRPAPHQRYHRTQEIK